MKTTTTMDVRINNRKRIINTLFRNGAMTKQDIANKLEISPPTVTVLLKDLREKGLIKKGQVMQSTGGRKPVCIAPIYNAKYAVGIEISSHELRIAVVDLGANIVAAKNYPFEVNNTKECWTDVNRLLMDIIDENIESRDKLLGVGIAFQTTVSKGRIIGKKNMPEQYQINLEMAASCFNVPVRFLSSGKVSAIAQIWALNDWDNFVFISLGSNISGTFVYNSNVMDFDGHGGDLGNIFLKYKDQKINASEACSVKALFEKAKVNSLIEFFDKIDKKDKEYVPYWEEYLDILSVLIHNLYCISGWKIVIGGSMSPYIEKYKEEVFQRLYELSDYQDLTIPTIRVSDLGEFCAAVGAALLPIDEFLKFGYDQLDS